MMWSVVILLSTALSVASYTVPDTYKCLDHGRQLKIYLPKSAEMLEFSPADNSSQTYLYWQKSSHRLIKGRVSGTGSDRRWYIDTVTFKDRGTYTLRDYWKKEISTVKVNVTYTSNKVKCKVGENLRISLQGIDLADASLYFSGEAGNFTLVRKGARVSQDLPDYFDRVVTQHDSIMIKRVKYADKGRYVVRNRRGRLVSATWMDLTARRNDEKCIAGENLRISLQGIDLADATLVFFGKAGNFTLVRNGARVSQDLPDYFDRVVTQHDSITIKHVKYTDEGRYTVKDRRDRVVSVTRMDLTVPATSSKRKALLALLLLLGIPAGICWCCKKCKTEDTTTSTQQTTPDVVHPPSVGPVGLAPPYNNPGQPGVFYHGPTPGVGFNPAYPPQNPIYPPVGPAMVPPAQPPQWNGPPPGQYPPGPTAPMGYAAAPVMYSEPVKEELKTENMASSPVEPLLTAQTQPESSPVAPASSNAATSPGDAYKFQIDGVNSSTNFL